MRVAVGSLSRYKLTAAEDALRLIFPDTFSQFEIVPIDAPSGIAPQPMSHEECIFGASNRARFAFSRSHADIAIGIENGLVEIESMWFATTWILTLDVTGVEGIASTLMRPVPPRVMASVHQGLDLAEAVRLELDPTGDNSQSGYIGMLTNGVLNRHDVLRAGVITAISHHLNRELFRDAQV